MDYSWRNLKNIYEHLLKLGMLSPPEDIIGSWMLFGSLPKINNFLELGSYIGGGVAAFNEALYETGHTDVNFVGVDHLEFIGAKTQGRSGAWYTDHFNRCLTPEEINQLGKLVAPEEAAQWIIERTNRLTNKQLNLTCLLSESELGSEQRFDIIHHDYGDGVEENLTTMRRCVPLLSNNGVYIVDDWCTGAPLRTWATVLAQQENLLFPFMWCKNKVFFAKSSDAAQDIVKKILSNPNCNRLLFKPMRGSDYFGKDYVTIRMHWQAMQWA
jgi:hypothetical protein